ncbi:hypothetical protein NQ314_020984 [Rhamnusium bicolor]|uniref:Uncharacterized protein n=1 Tax=Rhamnusium bicolor TaxID=1586634 RepID=A0AAV8WIJ7_9CUCU|nr:hypothetical protein NQ314_020984 [Rhamnusium bicolor]
MIAADKVLQLHRPHQMTFTKAITLNIYTLKMERENVLLFLTTVQIAATALYTAWKLRKTKRWRSRRWWVRPIMARREEHGDFATLFQELKEDPVLFFRYTRMNVPTFYELLHLISPHITKAKCQAFYIS